MNDTDYTTFLIRNIPRKEWSKIKIACLQESVGINSAILKIINKISKGEISVGWYRENIFRLHGFKARRKLLKKIQG